MFFWDNNVGIGIYNPAEKLDVLGNIKTTGFILNNGQQAVNKVLQSDANGLANWVDPMSLNVDDGDWYFNGNNMYNTNTGNVGIGVPIPSEKLEVAGTVKATGLTLTDGNQANGRILQSDALGNASWVDMPPFGDDDWTISGSNVYRLIGNVGIGLQPNEKLDVAGTLRVYDAIKGNSAGASTKLVLKGSDNTNSALIELWKGASTGERSLKLTTYQTDGNIEFRTNNTMRINMKGLDEMIIGTPNDNYNVKVNGKIDAYEIEVHVGNWWDEVFKEGYQLRPLEEVADYINKNGHLPDIPSEKEVLENGIKLGEMNALLVKKIEELTLYVIELEKKIEEKSK